MKQYHDMRTAHIMELTRKKFSDEADEGGDSTTDTVHVDGLERGTGGLDEGIDQGAVEEQVRKKQRTMLTDVDQVLGKR